MYTSHGHHIHGTVMDAPHPTASSRARCGGPGLCNQCSREAGEVQMGPTISEGIPFTTESEGVDYPMKARRHVQRQINQSGIGTPRGQTVEHIEIESIYVIWFSYVVGNWKAVLSTDRPDGRIWEVTHKAEHDGSDGPAVTYVDSYIKTHNIPIYED